MQKPACRRIYKQLYCILITAISTGCSYYSIIIGNNVWMRRSILICKYRQRTLSCDFAPCGNKCHLLAAFGLSSFFTNLNFTVVEYETI